MSKGCAGEMKGCVRKHGWKLAVEKLDTQSMLINKIFVRIIANGSRGNGNKKGRLWEYFRKLDI